MKLSHFLVIGSLVTGNNVSRKASVRLLSLNPVQECDGASYGTTKGLLETVNAQLDDVRFTYSRSELYALI